MKNHLFFTSVLLCLLLLAAGGSLRAQGDTLYNYRFETGVDSAQWLELTNPVSLSTAGDVTCSFGFTFYFGDNPYTQALLDTYGGLYFEGVSHSMGITVNRSVRAVWPAGTAMCAGYYSTPGTSLQQQVFGDGAQHDRVYVLQFHYPVCGQQAIRDWQLQLREADNSITFVYAPCSDSLSPFPNIGIRDGYDIYSVNTDSHTVSPAVSWPQIGWPDAYRYYRFTLLPTCPRPRFHEVCRMTDQTAVLRWKWRHCHRSYHVTWDTLGGSRFHDTLTTTDTMCLISGLLPEHHYVARVYAICEAGDTSYVDSILFRTPCAIAEQNINFSDLYADGVTCRTGSFTRPSTTVGVVDYGSVSEYSRHTVNYDATQYDPRTDNQLRLVPEGHCVSVRLGNWLSGAEQEEISYTIWVDTNRYDLLLLRYALVEEQPGHAPEQQPRFELLITDSADNLVSECYHGNFVSGDNSGWNPAPNGLVWRDWQAVGVDLAPLHGQLVHVKLSNYDCGQYGHFGYAYFVLDTDMKNIRAKNCGEMNENTFYAPEGFQYRWYSETNPFRTLSTADSLHVTETGRYFCQVSYALSGQTCGFTLSTDAYNRYPAAAFVPQPLDTCGARWQFVNQSVVARNSSLTDLTDEPCETYLWDFGDGTTSAESDPQHVFPDGDFTVTLTAMLSDGQCSDTASQLIHSHVEYDTIADTICMGDRIDFHNRVLDTSGSYSYNAGCQGERLLLQVWPLYDFDYSDTAYLGTPYLFGSEQYDHPGVYRQVLTSIGHCDSVQTLHLSSIEDRDSLACQWDMPLRWWNRLFADAGTDTLRLRSAAGTDSLVSLHLAVRRPSVQQLQLESTCVAPARYTITLPDSMRYTWRSEPPDPALPPDYQAGRLYLVPPVPTTYYFETDYPDAPSCPILDSLFLDPPDSARVRLVAEPAMVTEEFPGYRVTDIDSSSRRHMWFVDEVPQKETLACLYRLCPPASDSILVTAVGFNGPCADTASVWIHLVKQRIFFPNIFTPDESSNNRFRGVGVNVKDYELRIFTKWGDEIFRTTDIMEGWDGTRNGRQCPAAAYVYRCSYTTLSGRRETVTGTVVLVR